MMYWFNLGQSLTMLALESQEVIALRIAKMSAGGVAATSEARLMISEKSKAAVETGFSLASGGSAASIVSAYREEVLANRLRLTAL